MRARFLLAALLSLPALVSGEELVRPPPRGTSPQASAITASRLVGTEPAGVAYLKSLPADIRGKVEKDGQALIGEQKENTDSYGGYIRAVAIFHQPKQRVFELMRDTSAQAQYLPHLAKATVLSHPPNGEVTEFTVKVLWKSVTFHVRHWFYPEQSRTEWALDKSFANDIRAQEGYWQLFEMSPDETIGEYGTRVDTGLAVPRFIQDLFAKADIPKALTAFRKYMDSNGTYRRD